MNIDSTLFMTVNDVAALLFGIGPILCALGVMLALKTAARKRGIAVGVLGVVVLAIGLALAVTTPSKTATQQTLVASTYGVQLDDAQVGELKWPNRTPDASDHIFGTTTVLGAGRTPVTIHLLWDGSQLILVDDAGVELPRTGS